VSGGISEVSISSSVIASTLAQSVSEGLFILDGVLGCFQFLANQGLQFFVEVGFGGIRNDRGGLAVEPIETGLEGGLILTMGEEVGSQFGIRHRIVVDLIHQNASPSGLTNQF
jgi:hypothetical protein